MRKILLFTSYNMWIPICHSQKTANLLLFDVSLSLVPVCLLKPLTTVDSWATVLINVGHLESYHLYKSTVYCCLIKKNSKACVPHWEYGLTPYQRLHLPFCSLKDMGSPTSGSRIQADAVFCENVPCLRLSPGIISLSTTLQVYGVAFFTQKYSANFVPCTKMCSAL